MGRKGRLRLFPSSAKNTTNPYDYVRVGLFWRYRGFAVGLARTSYNRRLARAVGIAAVLSLAAGCSRTTLPPNASRAPGAANSNAAVSSDSGSSQGDAGIATSSGGLANGTANGTANGPSLGASAGSSSLSDGSTGSPAAANSSNGSPGVTPKSITISVTAGFSATYGAIFTQLVDSGYGTWVDDINARGGIFGRKIILKKADNRDTAEGGVAACKDIQTNGTFFPLIIEGLGGADSTAGDCLDKGGIPTLGIPLSVPSSKWTNIYIAASNFSQWLPVASFIQHRVGDPNPKVGFLYGNDPYVNGPINQLIAEVKQRGMPVVHSETFSPGQSSFVAPLTRMKSAGATTVVISGGSEIVSILRDARAIDYHPHWTGSTWAVDEFSQAAPALFNGIRALRAYPSNQSPKYAEFVAKARQYQHAYTSTAAWAMYGIGVMTEKILTALGPNPTRAAIPAAIDSLGSYSNGVNWPQQWGPGVRAAKSGVWPVECCNTDGTWKSFGDPSIEF